MGISEYLYSPYSEIDTSQVITAPPPETDDLWISQKYSFLLLIQLNSVHTPIKRLDNTQAAVLEKEFDLLITASQAGDHPLKPNGLWHVYQYGDLTHYDFPRDRLAIKQLSPQESLTAQNAYDGVTLGLWALKGQQQVAGIGHFEVTEQTDDLQGAADLIATLYQHPIGVMSVSGLVRETIAHTQLSFPCLVLDRGDGVTQIRTNMMVAHPACEITTWAKGVGDYQLTLTREQVQQMLAQGDSFLTREQVLQRITPQ